jgi:hypothetical protein
VHVKVDASNLPGKYTAVVIGCCLNFPRKLIFFLTATFKARRGARALAVDGAWVTFRSGGGGPGQRRHPPPLRGPRTGGPSFPNINGKARFGPSSLPRLTRPPTPLPGSAPKRRAQVDYLLWSYDLPLVDSYFMLDCSDADALARLGDDPGGGGGGGGGRVPLRRVAATAAQAEARAGARYHGPGTV